MAFVGYLGTIFFSALAHFKPRFVHTVAVFYVMYASSALIVVLNPVTLAVVKDWSYGVCWVSCFAGTPNCPPASKPLPEPIF